MVCKCNDDDRREREVSYMIRVLALLQLRVGVYSKTNTELPKWSDAEGTANITIDMRFEIRYHGSMNIQCYHYMPCFITRPGKVADFWYLFSL